MRWLATVLVLALAPAARGADGSGPLSDIPSWYLTASEGDTFTIGPGNHSVTSTIVFDRPVGVNIVGSGNGTNPVSDTILVDDLSGSNNVFLMSVTDKEDAHFRFTNFRCTHGTRAAGGNVAWFLTAGAGTFRIDNVVDYHTHRKFFRGGGRMTGVIDHNEVRTYSTSKPTKFWFFLSSYGKVNNGGYGVDAEWGDGSWAQPIGPGNSEAVYIEDNTFVFDYGATHSIHSFSDYYGGCRVVWRKNTMTDLNWASHGTGDGSGNDRGPVRVEYYWNTITYTEADSQLATNCRGGWILSALNDFNANVSKIGSLKQYLYHSHHGKFGQSDGGNEWDQNDLTDGASTPGGAGDGVFEAGTASVGTGDQLLVDTSKNWDPDQWVNYVVRVTTTNTIDWPRGYIASVINASTPTSLSVAGYANTTPGPNYNGAPESSAASVDFNDNGGSPDTITRSTGSFLDDGFIDASTVTGGMRVDVRSATNAANNGVFLATEVTATTITLDASESLTTDPADAAAVVKMIKWGNSHPVGDKPFEVGESYEIRRVDLSFDQTGAGPSTLITRAATGGVYNDPPASNQNTKISDGGDTGAPNYFKDGARIRIPVTQGIFPAYFWGNDHPGDSDGWGGEAGIIEDYHWFKEKAGFDGSTGVGVGPLASRPSSPELENVGYFADDQGPDRDGDGNADGILYTWDGAQWNEFWQPFTYPHPLVGGAPAPPVQGTSTVLQGVTASDVTVGQ